LPLQTRVLKIIQQLEKVKQVRGKEAIGLYTPTPTYLG